MIDFIDSDFGMWVIFVLISLVALITSVQLYFSINEIADDDEEIEDVNLTYLLHRIQQVRDTSS